jgi:endonuclease YncB( thermonuclease family)
MDESRICRDRVPPGPKVLLLLAIGLCFPVHAGCPSFAWGPLQSVAKVFDGDTFALSGGARVRLAGIDTPELGHGEGPDAPWAREAERLLGRILAESGGQVRLEPARESHDAYGRLLAHIYTRSGRSIQEQILQAGFGLGYARPPNLEHLDCYRAAETRARRRQLGLWHLPPRTAGTLPVSFARVQGVVSRVKNTRRSTWIELGSNLSLRIAREDSAYFTPVDLDHLGGEGVEARGYVHSYRGRTQIRIRHPADLRILD